MYQGGLKKVVVVVNSAKNLIKMSPLIDKLRRFHDFLEPLILFTGRPFGKTESAYLFEEMQLPQPHQFLGVPNGLPDETTGQTMIEATRYFKEIKPDLVITIGGSDAALGASISAARLGIPIGHIEAGLRCPGGTSNTDINRRLVDSISELFFVTDCNAHANIISEGVPEEKVFFVGNIMVDALQKFLPLSEKSRLFARLGLAPKAYAVLTLHRRANTTNYDNLKGILSAARQIAEKIPVVLVCYRRVREEIENFGLKNYFAENKLMLAEVWRYPDFLAIERSAAFTMTDSGTTQVESSALGIPCLTLRKNTEWTATVSEGTNIIVGPYPEKIVATAEIILAYKAKEGGVPKYWDGQTAQRIADVIIKSFPVEKPGTRKIKTSGISD